MESNNFLPQLLTLIHFKIKVLFRLLAFIMIIVEYSMEYNQAFLFQFDDEIY